MGNNHENPRYAVIFTSQLANSDAGYERLGNMILSAVQRQKGFMGADSVRDAFGRGITVSYWDCLESIKTWKRDALHQGVQERGREAWYSEYSIRICKIEEDRSFSRVSAQMEREGEIIQDFIDMIEAKDLYTQGHSHHVKVVTEAIYDCLPSAYQQKLDRRKLAEAALLHDVGKILTPDFILNKPAALADDEWLIMKQHPENSVEILKNTCFAEYSDWILYHHERVDGRGYYGLKGEDIPLESRIIAVADTFSALRTYRVYRPALNIAETVEILRNARGAQLDQEIVDCFLSLDLDFLEALECNCEICRQRRAALEAVGQETLRRPVRADQ